MRSLSRRNWILLILITLFWGINWPIMKIGVTEFPPITFRTLSMFGGLPAIWMVTRLRGISLRIPPGQLSNIAKLAVPNMMIWHLCIILGVRMLSSGRTAILGYMMPVWAVLSSLLFFRERVTRLAWLGIACALAGALLLLSSEFATLSGSPLGSVLVLAAAASWGYGTVALKKSQIEMPTISLTFWMLAITTLAMGVAEVLFESSA